MWYFIKIHFITILVAFFSQISNGYKILMIFSSFSPSHYILGNALAQELIKFDYEVTMITGFESKTSHPNFTEVLVTGLMKKDNVSQFVKTLYFAEDAPVYKQLLALHRSGLKQLNKILSNSNVSKLLESNKTFDAVIIEQFFNDGLKYFAHHYQAQLILLSTLRTNGWVNTLTGNPEPPSYIADIHLGYKTPMTFFERASNFIFKIFESVSLQYVVYPAQEKELRKHFPNTPDLKDIIYNVSLVLLNSHESLNLAVPYVPNMVNIGGFHISPPKKLPPNIQEYIDHAKEGVIFFSLGSNLIPSLMPEEIYKSIVKVLGTRDEKVLWKWDEENMAGKPQNIFISKWFPQQDILAHTNVKLFITHCGILSITEAIYHGVPILCLPIFGDQKLNSGRVSTLRIGESIRFKDVNEENFDRAIETILSDPQYRTNVFYRSKILQDRLLKPADLAKYWIKYVIEHKGAPHLRVEGVKLTWYQYILLDVILALLLVNVFVFFIVVKLFNFLFKKCKSKEKQN